MSGASTVKPKASARAGKGKGNKNALKHGGYAKGLKPNRKAALTIEELLLRLSDVNDRLFLELRKANENEEMIKLVHAFTSNSVAIFNGYRTASFVSGSLTPIQEAYNELKTLEFDED